MDLLSKTKEIMEHFNIQLNKSYGQNFLIKDDVLSSISDAAKLDKDTLAIEIGPGIGTLTAEIAKTAGKVFAIEIDKKLIDVLHETLSNYDNVEVINKDALKVDYGKIISESGYKKVKVVANLPYYITTPIITKLMGYAKSIESMTFMVQKEAADRILSEPGEDEYGTLALICRYYADIERVCKVSRDSFMPQPRVESVVIQMDIREKPVVQVDDERLFFSIIKSSFSMRRKTLNNALKPVGSHEALERAFKVSGIDPRRRGETLTIEEFAKLSNAIKK